jgi:hypothetical protein
VSSAPKVERVLTPEQRHDAALSAIVSAITARVGRVLAAEPVCAADDAPAAFVGDYEQVMEFHKHNVERGKIVLLSCNAAGDEYAIRYVGEAN